MKTITTTVGIALISGSLALAAQSTQSSTPSEKPRSTTGTSQTGTPVRSGAPAGRHATSKPMGTSGTSQTGTTVKSGAPAGRHATSKSTSHTKKQTTHHKKQTTPKAPTAEQ